MPRLAIETIMVDIVNARADITLSFIDTRKTPEARVSVSRDIKYYINQLGSTSLDEFCSIVANYTVYILLSMDFILPYCPSKFAKYYFLSD